MLKIIDFGMCVEKIKGKKLRFKGGTERYLPFNLRDSDNRKDMSEKDIMKIDLFSIGMIGLRLFCKSLERIKNIENMKNSDNVKVVT